MTKITPFSSGAESLTTLTGSVAWRARISPRWLGCRGSRCCAITIGAPKSGGRLATTRVRASIPPAEEPMTTSCGSVACCCPTMPHSRRSFGRSTTRSARGPDGRAVAAHIAGFHPRVRSPARPIFTVTNAGVRDLLLPSAGCSDFWGNRRGWSGKFPLAFVDERPGPRRVRFVPSPEAARGQPPGLFVARPMPDTTCAAAREDARRSDPAKSVIPSSRPLSLISAFSAGRPSGSTECLPLGDPAPIGFASPSPRGTPDGEGLPLARRHRRCLPRVAAGPCQRPSTHSQ